MNDQNFLREAISQAKKSVEQGGFPAGAVLVTNGRIVASGMALGNSLYDPTSHPDIAAIREACRVLKTTTLPEATLYVSLESCSMCFSASYWANVSRVVYAAKKTEKMIAAGYYEGETKNETLNTANNRKIELVHISELESAALQVIADWEEKMHLPKTA